VFCEAEVLLQSIETQAMLVPRIQFTACSSAGRNLKRLSVCLKLNRMHKHTHTHNLTYIYIYLYMRRVYTRVYIYIHTIYIYIYVYICGVRQYLSNKHKVCCFRFRAMFQTIS
jgi:hypothetical protein